jgi:hypothetical protein
MIEVLLTNLRRVNRYISDMASNFQLKVDFSNSSIILRKFSFNLIVIHSIFLVGISINSKLVISKVKVDNWCVYRTAILHDSIVCIRSTYPHTIIKSWEWCHYRSCCYFIVNVTDCWQLMHCSQAWICYPHCKCLCHSMWTVWTLVSSYCESMKSIKGV